jgi:hypothetical protein
MESSQMPTPDTFLRAQADALRMRHKPRLDPRKAKLFQQLDEGAGETLRAYTRPSELLRETVLSAKQLATQPVQSAKALVAALRDPESRNKMIGSMVVPDPLKLAKVLRAGKLPSGVKADIVVPETLALPEEAIELALAKRGAPDHETGWFQGPDGLFRKELQPARWSADEKQNLSYEHPDLDRRFELGGHGEPPQVKVDWDRNMGPKTPAMYRPRENDINIDPNRAPVPRTGGEMFVGTNGVPISVDLHNKLGYEMLTHELQHAIQSAAMLKDPHLGDAFKRGTSFRRYLQNPGEIEARAAGARDHLLDPRYRELVPFNWNTKKMAERLRHGMNTPKMEGPKEYLQDMEQWLQLAEPNK